MSIESAMPSNHLFLYYPFLLLPSIFPSIEVFSNELALHNRCPNYWSFSFSISPSSEYSSFISFRTDWFELLAVQRILSWKVSILWCSVFFMVQFLHPYMTTGKTTSSVQFSSVDQSCLTLCDPMNRSIPGLPTHHQLLEFTQILVH